MTSSPQSSDRPNFRSSAGPAPTGSRCWRRHCSHMAPRNNSIVFCRKSPVAKKSGRRPGPSPNPVPTSLACVRVRRRSTAAGCSTGRRRGARVPATPTGASACSAPIRMRSATRASRISCSTSGRRVSPFARSISSTVSPASPRSSSKTSSFRTTRPTQVSRV